MNWPLLIILLLITGFILLMVEVFIVPGFGPVGIGALLFLAAGGYLSWTKLTFLWAFSVTILSIASIIGAFLYLKKSGLMEKFVLGQKVKKDQFAEEKIEPTGRPSISQGKIGTAITNLRPTGAALFDGQRINVLTDGEYVTKNSKIKILRIEGNRIFVEEEMA